MGNKAYFISDIHFGLEDKTKETEKENALIELINSIEADSELIILGDLFDYWFEYKYVIQKGYYRFFAALKNASERNVKIHYLIGNHDFLHRDFFRTEFSAEVYEDNTELEINGKKFYLAHGDGLLPNDKGYLILKKIFRNKFFQKLYSFLHPDLGIAIAKRTSKKSRDYTQQKDYGEQNALLKFAERKIDEGFDYIVMGHSHKKEIYKYKDGFYVNLGSWIEKPYYGVFDGNKFQVLTWERNEKRF